MTPPMDDQHDQHDQHDQQERPDGADGLADGELHSGLFSGDADHLRAIEAMILVAQEPVAPELLAQLLERSVTDVERWCHELAAGYEADGRGFQLVRVAGGYRLQTHPDLTPYVERFLLHDQRARLSGAALETLAIVAYKQPISRAQVASIRGVDPDGVLRTLQGRGYIDVVGHDNGPGQATLYGTTSTFLEKLGLDRIEDLPPIAEFIPGAEVVEALEVGLRVGGPSDPPPGAGPDVAPA
jgi:segregation and condensation protein B